ncbi:HEAT repeat domain-containing protein [Candidatus Thorarchaeota archaeon]|nr:MAG: HEAT repeat domain-containing protein [Candidatus Thorarchaeota archaeon]
MPSRDWEYFLANYYGDPYMMWHDGIDEKSVTRLSGDERRKAEVMLIDSLEDGSHYGAIGLRELRSTNALPDLERLLPLSTGTLRVEIAVALSLIRQSVEYVSYILDVLKNSAFWSCRIRAAIALRRFPSEQVVEALFEAVAEDPDYLVRNHSSETILFLHGMIPRIADHKEIFQHMIVEFEKEDKESIESAFAQYKRSADLLRELIRQEGRLRAGPFVEDIWG